LFSELKLYDKSKRKFSLSHFESTENLFFSVKAHFFKVVFIL